MTKRANLVQSLTLFFAGVGLFLAFRWAFIEPYVIPSGSMIPSLLIYDHITVKKYAYGLRFPFSEKWLWGPKSPDRGDVVVFRSVEDADFFMVKRVIALPGDELRIRKDGELVINGKPVPQSLVSSGEVEKISKVALDEENLDGRLEGSQFYLESLPGRDHLIRHAEVSGWQDETFEVPDGHLFVMGDNRDSSKDSRFWGFLPMENLLGEASAIWLSCEAGLAGPRVLCDPKTIRWKRIFSWVR